MTLSFPIVGSHFHPPAKVLLFILPSNTPLYLDPDPDGPHGDPDAIQVNWRPPTDQPTREALCRKLLSIEDDLLACGFTPDDILSQSEFQLGFIPRSDNPRTRGPDGGTLECAAAMAASPNHSAHLSFDPTGQPIVVLSHAIGV